MISWSTFIALLIVLVDVLAIVDLLKRKNYSMDLKLLWMIIILLFPLIGVALYYFQKSQKTTTSKGVKKRR